MNIDYNTIIYQYIASLLSYYTISFIKIYQLKLAMLWKNLVGKHSQ